MEEGNPLFIFESKYWEVVLNPNQTYLGRSVLLLKRQCGDLAEITRDEILDFFDLVKKMESMFREVFGATMFNWSCLMNNAYQEKPSHPQVHWHFIPRYDHPVEFAGKTFRDPNFSHRSISEKTAISGEETALLLTVLREASLKS